MKTEYNFSKGFRGKFYNPDGSSGSVRKIESIDEAVLVVKINQTFREGMSNEELYEIVRGIWKVDKRRLDNIRYVFGVFYGVVKEVYEVISWNDAGTSPYAFRTHTPKSLLGRSEFVGEIAPDRIRNKYREKYIDRTYQAVNYYNC